MNKIKMFENFDVSEALDSKKIQNVDKLFTIKLDRYDFDMYINGKIYLDSKNEIKLRGEKGELLKDLKSLGFDEEYEYEIDLYSEELTLNYYWKIETDTEGISSFEFVPASGILKFTVNKIDRGGDETKGLDFEKELEFDNYNTETYFPLNDISVSVDIGKDKEYQFNDYSKWLWNFEIGSP